LSRDEPNLLHHRSATSGALAVMLTGAGICALWIAGLSDATRLVPTSSTVRFTTGLCFFLAGVALLSTLARRPRVALAAVIPVILLAAVTLVDYVLGRDLAFELLGRVDPATLEAGRMAPNTAAALLLAALGMLALQPGGTRIWALSIASMLGALTGALGLVAVLGYAFDLTGAFEWAGLTRMALLTAMTLFVLGTAIMLAAREVGRIGRWLELPWLASSVGVGTAGLGLLASHALTTEAGGLPARFVGMVDLVVVAIAILLAGTLAQARHNRLLTLRLAAANRRQAEQSAEIADLYENAPCGYHSLDAEARFVRINRTELDWLGYEREELVGRESFTALLTPESRARFLEHFERLKRHEDGGELALELRRRDGSLLPVTLSETAVDDAGGAFHHSRSTVFDSSERRRFEQQLRDSERRLQLLLDSLEMAVVVHAADSSIEFANPRAAELLGLTQDQLLGRTAMDPRWHFVREDGSPMPVEEFPVSRVMGSGHALRGYVVGVRVDDTVPLRWMLVDAVPAKEAGDRVRQVIVSFTDISERQRLKLQLEELASTDSLTGLATRRRFLELAGHELARARRNGRPISLIVLDLDHFKDVNDRWGHAGGDRVLRATGDLLRRSLREFDLAARWGGEEFCLLLPDTEAAAALATAERLREAIAAMPVPSPPAGTLRVTASLGVAATGSGSADIDALVEAADQAMYRAKREGRNRVRRSWPETVTPRTGTLLD
jgi:diguanylate cyclase (GGDEF)-like protein/PAS domain S-box-containing protein